MGYETALNLAWDALQDVARDKRYSVKFLTDEYTVDLSAKIILSLSCNVPAKDFLSIIILHYLVSKINGIPKLKGEWVSFKQLAGGQGYFDAFKKRVLDVILKKYGKRPEQILNLIDTLKAKKTQIADFSIVFDSFEGVPVLLEIWAGDDEFGPETNMLFDKNISDIFCTEDIVIIAEFIARHI